MTLVWLGWIGACYCVNKALFQKQIHLVVLYFVRLKKKFDRTISSACDSFLKWALKDITCSDIKVVNSLVNQSFMKAQYISKCSRQPLSIFWTKGSSFNWNANTVQDRIVSTALAFSDLSRHLFRWQVMSIRWYNFKPFSIQWVWHAHVVSFPKIVSL